MIGADTGVPEADGDLQSAVEAIGGRHLEIRQGIDKGKRDFGRYRDLGAFRRVGRRSRLVDISFRLTDDGRKVLQLVRLTRHCQRPFNSTGHSQVWDARTQATSAGMGDANPIGAEVLQR